MSVRKPVRVSRKEQKVATRARLLDAARACFRDRDERDVSIQEIAAHAGTSVGSVYVHFTSREEMIAGVVGDIHSELLERMRDALAGQTERDLAEAVKGLSHHYLGILRGLRPYLPLLAIHSARTVSVDVLRVGGATAPLVQMLNATLASLAVTTRIRGDVGLLSAGLASLWRGAAISAWSRPATDEALVADGLADMTLALLERVAPGALEADAILMFRAMAQFLKTPASSSRSSPG